MRDQPAVVDDRDAVAEVLRLFHVVRRVEHARAGARLLAHELEQPHAALRIDADRRLVEQQHLGPVHDAAAEVEAALHAAAEALDRLLARDRRGPTRSSTSRDALRRARRRAGRRPRPSKRRFSARGQVLVERELLRHDAELRAAPRSASRDDVVPDARATRPDVGGSRPEMQPMVVDLPAPFGPSRPKIAPASAVKVTPSTATRSP